MLDSFPYKLESFILFSTNETLNLSIGTKCFWFNHCHFEHDLQCILTSIHLLFHVDNFSEIHTT